MKAASLKTASDVGVWIGDARARKAGVVEGDGVVLWIDIGKMPPR